MVSIHTVGGFSEVGKNMIVLELEDDAFIFDEGFFLPAIVTMQERDKVMTEKKLKSIKAIPDDSVVNSLRGKVCAQFISHAHLDHVGAVPFTSEHYDAPIYGTPFTIGVLNSLLDDNDTTLKNKIYSIKPNTTFYIKGKKRKYEIDFVHVTHSTIQASMISINTGEGIVIFSGDFKLDDTPVVGPKPNYKRLKELGKKGVLAFVVNSLYSKYEQKTPSENIARELLKETLLKVDKNDGLIVTTFASHIARLKSVIDFGKKINREVIFLGRSLDKYSKAAMESGEAPFFNNIRISKYRRQVEKSLHMVERRRKDYLIVCTGHQGEPGSILERISRKDLPFKITPKDNIVFSSSVIPAPVNLEQFAKMESHLKKGRPKIFRDAHVSGHGREDDIQEAIRLLMPKHIIPYHGGLDKTGPMEDVVTPMGYKIGKTCHLMKDGDILKL